MSHSCIWRSSCLSIALLWYWYIHTEYDVSCDLGLWPFDLTTWQLIVGNVVQSVLCPCSFLRHCSQPNRQMASCVYGDCYRLVLPSADQQNCWKQYIMSVMYTIWNTSGHKIWPGYSYNINYWAIFLRWCKLRVHFGTDGEGHQMCMEKVFLEYLHIPYYFHWTFSNYTDGQSVSFVLLWQPSDCIDLFD